MMDAESDSDSFAYDGKLRERMDIAHWVLDHMKRMSEVQAIPDLKAYEHMLNSLLFMLSPWWPNGFEDELTTARKKTNNNPTHHLNRERLEDKVKLLGKLLDETGIAFTRRKKAKISGEVKRLWEEFPPFPQSNEE